MIKCHKLKVHVVLLLSGAGPKRLRTILEGESLLNDASSITLFIVFLEQVQSYEAGNAAETGARVLGTIVKNIVVLAVGKLSADCSTLFAPCFTTQLAQSPQNQSLSVALVTCCDALGQESVVPSPLASVLHVIASVSAAFDILQLLQSMY